MANAECLPNTGAKWNKNQEYINSCANTSAVNNIRNNFIGNKLAFTPYEETRIKNGATARPTNTDNLALKNDFAPPSGDVAESNLDLNFKI